MAWRTSPYIAQEGAKRYIVCQGVRSHAERSPSQVRAANPNMSGVGRRTTVAKTADTSHLMPYDQLMMGRGFHLVDLSTRTRRLLGSREVAPNSS
jgi:hypothetical protein